MDVNLLAEDQDIKDCIGEIDGYNFLPEIVAFSKFYPTNLKTHELVDAVITSHFLGMKDIAIFYWENLLKRIDPFIIENGIRSLFVDKRLSKFCVAYYGSDNIIVFETDKNDIINSSFIEAYLQQQKNVIKKILKMADESININIHFQQAFLQVCRTAIENDDVDFFHFLDREMLINVDAHFNNSLDCFKRWGNCKVRFDFNWLNPLITKDELYEIFKLSINSKWLHEAILYSINNNNPTLFTFIKNDYHVDIFSEYMKDIKSENISAEIFEILHVKGFECGMINPDELSQEARDLSVTKLCKCLPDNISDIDMYTDKERVLRERNCYSLSTIFRCLFQHSELSVILMEKDFGISGAQISNIDVVASNYDHFQSITSKIDFPTQFYIHCYFANAISNLEDSQDFCRRFVLDNFRGSNQDKFTRAINEIKSKRRLTYTDVYRTAGNFNIRGVENLVVCSSSGDMMES